MSSKKSGSLNLNNDASKKKKTAKPPPTEKDSKITLNAPTVLTSGLLIRPFGGTSFSSLTKIYLKAKTIKELGLSQGSLVSVRRLEDVGNKFSVVSQLQAAGETQEDDSVEICHGLRKLTGSLIGERAVVEHFKGKRKAAESIEVLVETSPDTSIDLQSEKLRLEIQTALKDMGLLIPGLIFTLKESQLNCQIFQVQGSELDLGFSGLSLDNAPKTDSQEDQKEAYFYEPAAQLSLNPAERLIVPSLCGYESLGGLSSQIQTLKAKLQLPLRWPQFYDRFNMAPDRGFLLHGPPGTGKTMLLRAVAVESDAHVFIVNGPSIVSRYLGETELALRNIFTEARKYQPSIIFFDEIDALVPKRDSDDSGEAESRVVSTLLTLMDGMQRDEWVAVVGATNRPNSIDPALRRAGRFGQEIEIGIPDADARLEILKLQLQSIPNQLSPEFIGYIASHSHGYVGADLYALCRDAVSRAIQRGIALNQRPEEVFVQEPDLEKSLVDIVPSAMKEIMLETPKVYWSDVGGLEDVKQKLKETVEWPIMHADAFRKLGIQAPKGVLLYGPPGCSKTLIAKALATEAGLNFLAVKGPELFNKYVGESERSVREIFRKARSASPSIIFFDEIDALSVSRTSSDGGSSSSGDRVLTSLLNEMDGIEALNDVIVLAATNVPDTIDGALLRPGRLDRLVYVGPPDLEARKKILEIQFKKMTIAEDVDILYLANSTKGCSGAEVVALCQEAGLVALNSDINADKIQMEHFKVALRSIKKAITKEMLEYYEDFERQGRVA